LNNQIKEIILNVKKTKYIIIIIKVAIICFYSFYLLDNPVPFYELNDAMLYSISSEHLANGMYGFTNELMQRFNGGPFIPYQWVGTIHDTAIPNSQVGIMLLGSISFLIGGYTGLLFIGPLFAILLFIVSERISSKLFGPIPGLVTLIVIVTSTIILWNGRGPHTDLIFTLFVVLGFFYFVEFFHEHKNRQILFASIFFSISAVFRLSGAIIFPIELVSFFLIFIYHTYFIKISKSHNEIENHSIIDFQTKKFMTCKNIFLKIQILLKQNQKIIKWTIFMIIPWLVFFAFSMIFNYYYFDDPFTNHQSEYSLQKVPSGDSKASGKNVISSVLTFDLDRFDWIKYYTIGLIPDNLNGYLRDVLQIRDFHFIDHNWVSIIVYLVFLFSVFIAYFKKFKRLEVFLILILIFGFLLFLSISSLNLPYTDASEKSKDVQFRYMILSYVLFAMLIGLITDWVIKSNSFKTYTIKNTRLNFFKICFFIVLSLFLVSAIYESDAIKDYSEQKTKYFVYPDFDKELKPTRDELPENGIIITQQGRWTITFLDGIPFRTSWGWNSIHEKWDVNKINHEEIQIIKTLMDENYEFFSLKGKQKDKVFFFRYIEQQHNLILKHFSYNLCILEQVSPDSKSKQNSDDMCYGLGANFVEKFP